MYKNALRPAWAEINLSNLDFNIKNIKAKIGDREMIGVIKADAYGHGSVKVAEVLRENAFLSRTIEVSDNQKVIDTGLYGIVRHPMYLATIFLFLSMPLILGSLISFIVFLIYPFIIIRRLNNEEIILEKELKGYKEYKKKVRYKLIPFIW